MRVSSLRPQSGVQSRHDIAELLQRAFRAFDGATATEVPMISNARGESVAHAQPRDSRWFFEPVLCWPADADPSRRSDRAVSAARTR